MPESCLILFIYSNSGIRHNSGVCQSLGASMTFAMIREIGLAYSTYCTVPLALRPLSMTKIAGLFWSVDNLVHLSNSVLLSMPVSSAAVARAATTYSTVAAKLTVLVSPYPLAACLWHLIVPLFSLWSPVIGADCPSPGRSMRAQPDIHASFATSPLCNVTCITFILFLMSLIASFFLGL